MKTVKFFAASLFLVAMIVSCSKDQMDKKLGMSTAFPVVEGTIAVTGANNGGNITCEEVATATGCTFEYSVKIDYSGGSGGTVGPIKWWTDGIWVTWESAIPLNIAVIVKGGPNANVYFSGNCSDCVSSSGEIKLSAPINPKNGKPYGLSNITFCFSYCSDLVVGFKSFMSTDYVTSGKFITSYPLVLGGSYPLYRFGNAQPDQLVGYLTITDADHDGYWEINADNSQMSSLLFKTPYLYVGPAGDFDEEYLTYPYPNPKITLDPMLSTWIYELPFHLP